MIKKTLSILFLLMVIGGIGYYYRDVWSSALFPKEPCVEPLTYSVGEFDERFNISKSQFIETIQEAEEVWEEELGKELFTLTATGTIKINLIYDYRQQATQKLGDIGITINDDRNSYDKIKEEYDTMLRDYNLEKTSYETAFRSFDEDKKAYEKKVEYWNDRGGAPPRQYQELQNENDSLKNKADALNKQAKELNSLSNELNGTASILNDLVKTLNLKVNAFNLIGSSTGEEFNEGEYVYDKEGERINVYQFEDRAILRRLMQHEFGHALGLDHVNDKYAIMYRLNSSTNEKLTADDTVELYSACRIVRE